MDVLHEIFHSLRQNKLRTITTGFGVFWGIFMLMIMLGAGKGMQNAIEVGFGDETRDTMFFFTGKTSKPWKGMGIDRNIRFTLEDTEYLRNQIPGVRYIAIENKLYSAQITFEKAYANYMVMGVDDDYFRIKEKVPFIAGRKFNLADQVDVRKVISIGKPVAERLFGSVEKAVGNEIKVNGVMFTVTSVFFDRTEQGKSSERVYVPLTTFNAVFRMDNFVDVICARPLPDADGIAVEQAILKALQQRHGVSPDDVKGMRSYNVAQEVAFVDDLFFGINSLIWFVGLGTLMAGIVGISNIMIITVKERTKEIGIRKALGATPVEIVSGLLLESVLVTAVFGYLGMVIGVATIETVAFLLESFGAQMDFFTNPEIHFQAAMTAIFILVVVGAIAGFIPAVKAARIMPIEAMRAD